MEITNPRADDGRPAAGARPVLRQDSGDAMSGRSLALLPIGDVLARRDAGTMLLDVRDPAEFTASHVRGSVSIGLRERFEECAGAVLAPDRDVVLVGDQQIAAEAAGPRGAPGA